MTIRVVSDACQYLFDDATRQIVGMKQPDGSELYFPFVTTQPASFPAAVASELLTARLLFRINNVDMNSTADQQYTKLGTFSTWIAQAYRLVNPTVNLTTAAGGVYTAAAKGGDILVAASQTYATAGVAGNSSQAMTASSLGNTIRSETPYLSLTTGQGVACTATALIFGFAYT